MANDIANPLGSLAKPEHSLDILDKIIFMINQGNYNQQFTQNEGEIASLYILINILNDHKVKNDLDKIIDGEI